MYNFKYKVILQNGNNTSQGILIMKKNYLKKIFIILVCVSCSLLYASQMHEGEVESAEQLLQGLKLGDGKKAERLLELARQHFESGSPEALSILNRLNKSDIENKIRAQACELRGVIYRLGVAGQKKDYKKALESFLSGYKVADQKDRSKILLDIGMIYRDGGYGVIKDLEKAEHYYMQALAEAPNDRVKVSLVYELATLASQKKNQAEALKFYQVAEQQQVLPAISVDAAHALGNLYKDQGDLPKAVMYYQKAADQNYEPLAHQLGAHELVFLFFNGGPGIEKNLNKAQYYALRLLSEIDKALHEKRSPEDLEALERYAEGLRALLRLAGYKGKLPGVIKK